MMWFEDQEGAKFALNPHHIIAVCPVSGSGQPRVGIQVIGIESPFAVVEPIAMVVHRISEALVRYG